MRRGGDRRAGRVGSAGTERVTRYASVVQCVTHDMRTSSAWYDLCVCVMGSFYPLEQGEGGEGGTGGAVLHLRETRPQGGRGRIGLPEIRLDLGVVQRGRDMSEPTELQRRRDKFSFFEKHCSKVLDHLYAGSDVVAKNLDTLRDAGITHVLNCVGFVCPEYFPQDLTYKTLWLQVRPIHI